jgi:hypothetical protein
MIVLTYILAAIAHFVVGGMAAWIPLTIMHGVSGNKGSLWYPDPGNEQRFSRVHNWGQAIGAFVESVASLFVVLWIFHLFGREPHISFLILLGLSDVVLKPGAKEHFRPRAQTLGAVIGFVTFFLYYFNR